jgi:predicted lipase
MYNTDISKIMVQMCELTYQQYAKGTPPPGNKGIVTMPSGFTQIASFTAPEFELKDNLQFFHTKQGIDLTNSKAIASSLISTKVVYFGFAATSANYNVIALRGTQSDFEWLMDILIPQVPVPLIWFSDGKFQLAKVHLGFLTIFAFLWEQISAAAGKFDNKLPCIITGHSLGAALSVLTAPAIKLLTANSNTQVYNYACPRVGDTAFADAYDFFIPESYRVANLADLITILPPTNISKWEYKHVNTEWSFLNQTGNIGGNHALIGPDNYTDAVNKLIPTDAARTYPVTGL